MKNPFGAFFSSEEVPNVSKSFVGKNRLKTKAKLFRRHIVDDMSCARCGCVVENTLDVLRDCLVLSMCSRH